MNKILATSAAFVAAACAGEAKGIVKAYDEASKTFTLEDGEAFTLAEGVVADGVVAGAKVKVTFDDATNAASAVEAAKM